MDRILKNDRFHRYVAYNATLGTGLSLGIVAAYNDNLAFLTAVNPAASPYWCVLERLRMRVSAADTNSVNVQADIRHDPTDRTAVSPGGTALTSKDRLVGKPKASPVLVRAGAVTPLDADAEEQRIIAAILQTESAPAFDVGDIFNIDFDVERPQSSLYAGPIILGPGETALVHIFGASMASDSPSIEPHLSYRLVQKR